MRPMPANGGSASISTGWRSLWGEDRREPLRAYLTGLCLAGALILIGATLFALSLVRFRRTGPQLHDATLAGWVVDSESRVILECAVQDSFAAA